MKSTITEQSALLLANGTPCSDGLLREMFARHSLVIALDGAFLKLREHGLLPHIVTGDFDSLPDYRALARKYPLVPFIRNEDQDSTDLEKGLELALSKGITRADILWATGARADHYYANLSNMVRYSGRMDLRLLDDHSVVYRLPRHFEKEFRAGQVISLLPMGRVEGITTRNLKYALNNETLEIGGRIGTSNEVEANGPVVITHASGCLLLAECRD